MAGVPTECARRAGQGVGDRRALGAHHRRVFEKAHSPFAVAAVFDKLSALRSRAVICVPNTDERPKATENPITQEGAVHSQEVDLMGSLLEPLPGALIRDFKRCGHPLCKCASGALHGPYFARVWYEGTKRRKAYVKAKDAERTRASIELWGTLKHIQSLRELHAKSIGRKRRVWIGELIERFEREAKEIQNSFSLGE